ncbi:MULTISPECIES: LysR family transcriptional regulator [Leucobacter]|uniref:LysR family transcriptional regulator n=3 Tax=Micrococcales TaxID=85006 RepID=A0ABN3B947_9MICO|nr:MULTISPECIES: LysR family transcriptional regulator [Leucobacter]MBS3183098.1 LysR family transcriptional regulator [Leucobacter manosquensis]
MTTAFTLVQLSYFSAVARLENMTAAASELSVTQSTLSSAISQLERELAVELFTRDRGRGLQLTPAGRALLARGPALLEEAEMLATSVRSASEALSGELTVGIYAPLAPFRAPEILDRFEAAYPEVQLTFFEGDQGSLQEALHDGRCEVALMYDLGVDDRFARTVIDRVPPHVIVPEARAQALAGRSVVSLREFAADPFILLNLPHTGDYYLRLFRQLGLEPRIRHVSLGYETVRSYVARGHGYSILNQWLDQSLTYSGKRVVPLRLSDEFPPTEVSLVQRRDISSTRKAQAFIEVCRDIYQGRAQTSTPSIGGNETSH